MAKSWVESFKNGYYTVKYTILPPKSLEQLAFEADVKIATLQSEIDHINKKLTNFSEQIKSLETMGPVKRFFFSIAYGLKSSWYSLVGIRSDLVQLKEVKKAAIHKLKETYLIQKEGSQKQPNIEKQKQQFNMTYQAIQNDPIGRECYSDIFTEPVKELQETQGNSLPPKNPGVIFGSRFLNASLMGSDQENILLKLLSCLGFVPGFNAFYIPFLVAYLTGTTRTQAFYDDVKYHLEANAFFAKQQEGNVDLYMDPVPEALDTPQHN